MMVTSMTLPLPTVYDMLCQYTDELLRANNLESEAIKKLVTSRWVLSSLTATLQYHIAYKCTVRKYGTLIYRPNTDLLPVLTQALWRVRSHTSVSMSVPEGLKTNSEKSATNYLIHGCTLKSRPCLPKTQFHQ